MPGCPPRRHPCRQRDTPLSGGTYQPLPGAAHACPSQPTHCFLLLGTSSRFTGRAHAWRSPSSAAQLPLTAANRDASMARPGRPASYTQGADHACHPPPGHCIYHLGIGSRCTGSAHAWRSHSCRAAQRGAAGPRSSLHHRHGCGCQGGCCSAPAPDCSHKNTFSSLCLEPTGQLAMQGRRSTALPAGRGQAPSTAHRTALCSASKTPLCQSC